MPHRGEDRLSQRLLRECLLLESFLPFPRQCALCYSSLRPANHVCPGSLVLEISILHGISIHIGQQLPSPPCTVWPTAIFMTLNGGNICSFRVCHSIRGDIKVHIRAPGMSLITQSPSLSRRLDTLSTATTLLRSYYYNSSSLRPFLIFSILTFPTTQNFWMNEGWFIPFLKTETET